MEGLAFKGAVVEKTVERLKRTFMDIKSYLNKAQLRGTMHDDEVILEAARKIGIAIQLSGKGIQEAAEEGRFLDVAYFVGQAKSLSKVLKQILNKTIGQEFRDLKNAEPKDFL